MNSVRFIINSHPAAKAAHITSRAMRAAYDSARGQSMSPTASRTARRRALSGLAWAERVHNRVTETLKATPEAWEERIR